MQIFFYKCNVETRAEVHSTKTSFASKIMVSHKNPPTCNGDQIFQTKKKTILRRRVSSRHFRKSLDCNNCFCDCNARTRCTTFTNAAQHVWHTDTTRLDLCMSPEIHPGMTSLAACSHSLVGHTWTRDVEMGGKIAPGWRPFSLMS